MNRATSQTVELKAANAIPMRHLGHKIHNNATSSKTSMPDAKSCTIPGSRSFPRNSPLMNTSTKLAESGRRIQRVFWPLFFTASHKLEAPDRIAIAPKAGNQSSCSRFPAESEKTTALKYQGISEATSQIPSPSDMGTSPPSQCQPALFTRMYHSTRRRTWRGV